MLRKLIRPCVAMVCIVLLVGPGSGQTLGLVTQAQVTQLPRDKTLAVKLKSGATVKGRLLSVGDSSFEFQPEKETIFKSLPAPLSFAYQDVQSIKRTGHKTLIIVLVAIGAWAVVGGVMGARAYNP